MKPPVEFLRLPHFFLFKDLFYSHLESKKILREIQEGKESFAAHQVEDLAKHYLVLFEVLEFLHEYTPDFFVITKIHDKASDIVCFANQEFSKTFDLKDNPEGKEILKVLHKEEEEYFKKFIEEEIQKSKDELKNKTEDSFEVSVKSDSVELPVLRANTQSLYEVHVRLVGVITKHNSELLFEGYSIILGRDVTNSAVQKQLADSFTNIPESLHEKFYKEAFSRKILRKHNKPITLKNVMVLTGNSDICNSSNLRLEAQKEDDHNKTCEQIANLNKNIEEVNLYLHKIWEKGKERILNISPAVFLFEETDGIDYVICLEDKQKGDIKQLMRDIQQEELRTLAEIAQSCAKKDFALKHLIVAYDKKVDFYFEERFENRFKIETHSVDLFIKKRRLEKACDRADGTRILEESCVTVAVDTEEDFEFYKSLFEILEEEGIFEYFEEGEVEMLQGLKPSLFLRGKVSF